MVNASEVIKVKTLTIREIFAFLKQEQAQPLSTSNSGDNGDQFPGASVACESALGSTCSGGPSCEASAPNSAIGEKEVCKTQ
ncbi:hypothetical protein YC2023_090898 [Brassica napus]